MHEVSDVCFGVQRDGAKVTITGIPIKYMVEDVPVACGQRKAEVEHRIIDGELIPVLVNNVPWHDTVKCSECKGCEKPDHGW
jgi:hypothetical protein